MMMMMISTITIINKSKEMTVFSSHQKTDFHHETEARKVMVARLKNLMLYTDKQPPEFGLVLEICGAGCAIPT